MFASLSRLFKRSASKRKEPEVSPFSARPKATPNSVLTRVDPPVQAPQSVASTAGALPPEPVEHAAPVPASGNILSIPLHIILKEAPAEYRGTALPAAAAGKSFDIPIEKALKQLATGAVKVTLAELKSVSPSGLFRETSEHDQKLVDIPLKEVLSRLQRESYACRTDQHRIEVPDSISDLFGPRGQGLTDVRIANKKDAQPATGMAAVGSSAVNSPSPVPKSHSTTSFTNKIPVITRRPAQPQAPAPPAQEPSVIPASASLRMAMEQSALAGKPASASAQAPKLPAAPATAPDDANRSIMAIPLAHLSKAWPDSIQQEIAQQDLSEAECEFPIAQLTADMRKGKVAYPWSQIRVWLNPPSANTAPSPQDDTLVDVPLSVVTPFFMKRVVGGAGSAAPSAAAIPDVFAPERPVAKPAAAPAPVPVPPPAPAPAPTPVAAPVIVPAIAPIQASTPAPAATASAPAPAKPAQPVPEGLKVPLEPVSTKWPEAILQELSGYNLDGAQVEIPGPVLQKGLRSGKIENPWSQVRGWIEAVPGDAPPSPHASTPVELPLSVVAPLFFKNRQGQAAKKAYVPTDIPDLFSAEGTPQAPGQAAAPAPAPAPAPVAVQAAEPVAPPAPQPVAAAPVPVTPAPAAAPQKKPTNIAELFGEPKKKNWTPNEIVQRTAQLPGVAGAMIALQDGLLVAGSLPPDWKAETVAAFIPQMFGRMRQYTRELSIGDLKSLTFVVDKGPLQIFNAGLIYFVVLGDSEALMPVEEMNLIATELCRHTK